MSTALLALLSFVWGASSPEGHRPVGYDSSLTNHSTLKSYRQCTRSFFCGMCKPYSLQVWIDRLLRVSSSALTVSAPTSQVSWQSLKLHTKAGMVRRVVVLASDSTCFKALAGMLLPWWLFSSNKYRILPVNKTQSQRLLGVKRVFSAFDQPPPSGSRRKN